MTLDKELFNKIAFEIEHQIYDLDLEYESDDKDEDTVKRRGKAGTENILSILEREGYQIVKIKT